MRQTTIIEKTFGIRSTYGEIRKFLALGLLRLGSDELKQSYVVWYQVFKN